MPPKRYLIGNWKMNGTRDSWAPLARKVCQQMQAMQGLTTVLCPPPPGTADVANVLVGQKAIKLGAQSVHHQESGAFTGGISAPMLASLGVDYTLVGHSERRKLYIEEQGTVLRLQQCWRNGITPVLCIGESAEEHAAGETIKRLDKQLEDAFYGLSTVAEEKLIVAYEPVWAIGGVSVARKPQPAALAENFRFIRAFLVERFGDVGYTLPLLYGGSVAPDNAAEYMEIPDVQGLLVGAASLDADQFAGIAQAMLITKK